jgi:hypothetical protein
MTILFTHAGWKEPVEFMHHFSTKWATFLLSLRDWIEKGRGRPAPDDVEIHVGDRAAAAGSDGDQTRRVPSFTSFGDHTLGAVSGALRPHEPCSGRRMWRIISVGEA